MKTILSCTTRLFAASTFCALSLASFTANAAVPAGYYDSVNDSTAQALHNSLHEIIDDHTRFPYTSSSTDTWDVLEQADQDPDNANNVIDIYKNASYPKFGGGNSFYNREHSWPKSYGFPKDGSTNYPYTDMHHLFIANSGYNSSRSNKPYADCGAGCSEKITEFNNGRGGSAGESSWTQGSFAQGSWQTWSGRKGDVARALMYMAVRYEGGMHGVTSVTEPDLLLTDDRTLIENSNTGSNGLIAYMGLKSVLIQWHKEDPVDAFETRHNDTVYAYQGNRNPFVDHPEYVACVFEQICSGSGGGSGDTTPPAIPSGLNATGGTTQISLSWNANGESDLSGYNLYRSQVGGSGHVKVNSSLLTSTTYVDTGLSSNTSYYYLLSAVDSSANESANSNEVSATTLDSGTGASSTVWINEFHYDNNGSDVGEFVEVAGNANTDLSGWRLIAYNGNGGSAYKTVNLSGVIPNQQNAFGTLAFDFSGLQNGAPDAIALVDAGNNVVDFISYEGSMTATNDAAAGISSNDVGVSEASTSPVGFSLQLSGMGQQVSDFSWQPAASSTRGQLNTDQSIPGGGAATAVWINELHYDNSGSDKGEFVEIAGTANTDLSGWKILAYNGSDGTYYKTANLTGTINNQQNGIGTKSFNISGLQNGGPDGIALIDESGNVVQFISYEGTFTASNGEASGMTSTDIGVSETSSTSKGHSLQLSGYGQVYSDFSWQSAAKNTAGSINKGQSF